MRESSDFIRPACLDRVMKKNWEQGDQVKKSSGVMRKKIDGAQEREINECKVGS